QRPRRPLRRGGQRRPGSQHHHQLPVPSQHGRRLRFGQRAGSNRLGRLSVPAPRSESVAQAALSARPGPFWAARQRSDPDRLAEPVIDKSGIRKGHPWRRRPKAPQLDCRCPRPGPRFTPIDPPSGGPGMTQFQKHSISRKIKGISIIAASATALTLTGIGAAGAADGRAPLHTIAPDLRSVSVQSSHPDGNDPELVRYCFDKHLDQLSGAGGFALSGPDSRQPVTAQRVTRDVDDLSCAVAEYAPHTDVRTYTLGVVADDAVRDVQHNGNVEDSAALDGVAANAVPAPGRTSAPDLVGTEKDDTLNRIGFVFDERLAAPGANRSQAGSDQARRNPDGLRLLDLSRGLAGIITSQDNRMGRAFQAASYDPSAFGYYTLNGIAHRGQRIVAAPDGDRITIQFADGDHVSDAVRYFVEQAAVADNSGHANPEGASGAGTTRPDLVAVSHVAGSQTQFDYTFSEAVVNPDATFFTVHTQDATRYQGCHF